MCRHILLFGLTGFFIVNTYYDGKYVEILKSWKKYYQMATIAFVGLSTYVFLRKYPGQSRNLMTHANGIIKYMPIDKESSDLLTPFFNLTKSENGNGNDEQGQQHVQRMMNSGRVANNKRCVSETKKKYVAAQQGWKCGDCQRQLPAWFEVDHRVRLDSGGSNHVDNLVAMCRDCHGKKTAMENL